MEVGFFGSLKQVGTFIRFLELYTEHSSSLWVFVIFFNIKITNSAKMFIIRVAEVNFFA